MSINTQRYIEEYIKIRDKSGRIVNFKLNSPQQKLYNIIKKQKQEKKPVRVIILKARQMGFSTLTESILFKDTVTKFNRRTGIITHINAATDNLFNMSKLMLENLPEDLRPSIKNSNAKELVFDNENGTGLKSKIKCMTAGTSGVGRSDTFDNLHLSELAFWEGDVTATLTGLFQAVPNLPDTMIIIESTANGYEKFKELWDQAVNGENDFIPLFVAWYELPEYAMRYSGFKLTDEEEKLKELYNLTNEQLEWRRWCIRNNCQNSVEQFKQEYPSNPEEAFISTGACIFDKEKLIERLRHIPKPIKRGYFAYNEESATRNIMSDIKWINDTNGCIKIFKLPNQPSFTAYALGGDTAGDTLGDKFSSDVVDAKTLEQVATLTLNTDEDLYAKQMYCLGKYYGTFNNCAQDALIAVETNFSTFPQKKLEELGYNSFYVREVFDDYRNRVTKQFGFNTNRKTKPSILGNLVEVAREFIEVINDEQTLREMLTMVRKDNGKQEAETGFHDDKVMSLAITHHAISQVNITTEVVNVPPQHQFYAEARHYTNDDVGEEIIPI
jgi:hypothetical protein